MNISKLIETTSVDAVNIFLSHKTEKWMLYESYHSTQEGKDVIVYVLAKLKFNAPKHIPA